MNNIEIILLISKTHKLCYNLMVDRNTSSLKEFHPFLIYLLIVISVWWWVLVWWGVDLQLLLL